MYDVSSICVFCGSKPGHDPLFADEAAYLGRIMAEEKIRLIYGGGGIGLMGVIARSVLDGGGEVIGVIPEFLMQYEVGHMDVTELHVVESMHERKRRMFAMADAFVVLPGGLGTMDETMEITTWKQLQQHAKPIVVLNTNGCWDPMVALVDAVIAQGFAHPKVKDLFMVVDRADQVMDAISSAPQPDSVVLTSHL